VRPALAAVDLLERQQVGVQLVHCGSEPVEVDALVGR
jgi:hypothetical protein